MVVATTEHSHAFATLAGVATQEACLLRETLTRDVHEARIITEAAKAAGVATQMGTQIHAGTNYRRVVELVQGGAIGRCAKPTSGQSHMGTAIARGRRGLQGHRQRAGNGAAEEMPVPPELDWDLWLGPAPPGLSTPSIFPVRNGTAGGFRQWHDERSRLALERSPFLR